MLLAACAVVMPSLVMAQSPEADEGTPASFPSAAPCPDASEWPEGMACVEGGVFERGNDEGRPAERPARGVYVDTFYMELHEVTNEEYEECIRSRECERPMPFRRFRRPQQPAVAMSWFDAVNFCERLGRRLPTEAEWERAARGPDNTLYPWGNEERTCEAANVSDRSHGGRGCGRDVTRDVGSYPAGHWGLFDMAGNVHEWVSDWHSDCYEGCDNACGESCEGVNPQGPCDGAARCSGYYLREVRGGSWYWELRHARATARRGSGAPNRGPHRFGFRCAQSIERGVSAPQGGEQ